MNTTQITGETQISVSELVNEARSLRSDLSENTEYDRALVELVGYLIGAHMQDGDLETIRKLVLKDPLDAPINFTSWEM